MQKQDMSYKLNLDGGQLKLELVTPTVTVTLASCDIKPTVKGEVSSGD